MGELTYLDALKRGKKEQKKCLLLGRSPYLPVLDEILSHQNIITEQNLGLVEIPLENVVGTGTRGRTRAFAANFMPILDEHSEFACKWEALANAQTNEGIREPIKVYEFMNRFYVLEGNKRVSVLKFFGANKIAAYVTRKIPAPSEELDVKLYYEFMQFNEVTGLNIIEFTRPGKANKLIERVGAEIPWNERVKEKFRSIYYRFTDAYEKCGGNQLPITVGDAFGTFLKVYPYKDVLNMSMQEFDASVSKCWKEFLVLTEKNRIDLVLDPKEVHEKKSLFRYLLPNSAKKCTIAFLYPKTIEESNWTYAHDLGRNYLEDTFPEQISTICVNQVNADNIEEILQEVVEKGASIVFEVGVEMMEPSLKFAVEHPEITILNCSLNTPHKNIRTYYARMYEAKFISGMIAGALTENDKIAYVADYPIYGMIANINAFALGVACVNPRAKVYLDWSTRKDHDLDLFLTMHDIHYVSNQDMIRPINPTKEYGLYKYEDGETTNLLMPIWNWGIYYEKLLQAILAGTYKSEDEGEAKALNYWWGMSAGVIDLVYSKHIPLGVKRLAEHMAYDISIGGIVPFYGEIYAQDGTLKNKAEEAMSPDAIMKMDYLVENVLGDIPTIDLLNEKAKFVVELKGVEEDNEE